jgi:hypothetical protein
MIVAITGQKHSGAGLFAQALHRMRVPAAVHVPTPVGPRWHASWEDARLAARLQSRDAGPSWFIKYLAERFRHADQVFESGHVALWSPYLALDRTALELAADAMSADLRWLAITRPQDEIDAETVPEDVALNEEVRAAMAQAAKWAAIKSTRTDILENPKAVASSLALQLGITPAPDDLAAAITDLEEAAI